jgi:hypothetical protein
MTTEARQRGGGLETQIRLEPSVCSFFHFFLTLPIFLNCQRISVSVRVYHPLSTLPIRLEDEPY